MTEPISAALTEELLKESADLNQAPKQHSTYEVENSGFGQILDANIAPQAGGGLPQMLSHMVDTGPKPINAIPANEIELNMAQAQEVEMSEPQTGESIMSFFEDLNSGQNNMEGLIERMTSGEKFSTRELLVVQVAAHQHVMNLEIIAKAAEQVNSTLNKFFNMQV